MQLAQETESFVEYETPNPGGRLIRLYFARPADRFELMGAGWRPCDVPGGTDLGKRFASILADGGRPATYERRRD